MNRMQLNLFFNGKPFPHPFLQHLCWQLRPKCSELCTKEKRVRPASEDCTSDGKKSKVGQIQSQHQYVETAVASCCLGRIRALKNQSTNTSATAAKPPNRRRKASPTRSYTAGVSDLAFAATGGVQNLSGSVQTGSKTPANPHQFHEPRKLLAEGWIVVPRHDTPDMHILRCKAAAKGCL